MPAAIPNGTATPNATGLYATPSTPNTTANTPKVTVNPQTMLESDSTPPRTGRTGKGVGLTLFALESEHADMSVTGLCQICESAQANHSCPRCGRVVCDTHYDRATGLCTEDAATGGTLE